ncbi:MAG: hypothetical protein MJ252_05120 [archaeon]|nr:hypothetical protein [archaeon]
MQKEEKILFGQEKNLKGELKYNTEKILNEAKSLKEDKRSFVSYVGKILNTNDVRFLFSLYALFDFNFVLNLLEKTLNIMNEGGMNKEEENHKEEKRTICGTFMKLIKTSERINKKDLQKIFYKSQKSKASRKRRKKIYKKLNNLSLEE